MHSHILKHHLRMLFTVNKKSQGCCDTYNTAYVFTNKFLSFDFVFFHILNLITSNSEI